MKQREMNTKLRNLRDSRSQLRAEKKNPYPLEFWNAVNEAVAEFGYKETCAAVGFQENNLKDQITKRFKKSQSNQPIRKVQSSFLKLALPQLAIPKPDMFITIKVGASKIKVQAHSANFDWGSLLQSLQDRKTQ